MNKQILALALILCLISAKGFAQSTTHFEATSKYGTSSGTTLLPKPPDNCPYGFVLTFTGTEYKCVNAINNHCGPGQYVNGINADGSVDCKSLYASAPTCGPGQMSIGQDSNGNPMCQGRPQPQCQRYESNGGAWGTQESVAMCPNDHPILLTGGGHCARGPAQSTACRANAGTAPSPINSGFMYFNGPVSADMLSRGFADIANDPNTVQYGSPVGWATGCLPAAISLTGGAFGGKWCSQSFVVCCSNF